jgi:hypothetical protein
MLLITGVIQAVGLWALGYKNVTHHVTRQYSKTQRRLNNRTAAAKVTSNQIKTSHLNKLRATEALYICIMSIINIFAEI